MWRRWYDIKIFIECKIDDDDVLVVEEVKKKERKKKKKNYKLCFKMLAAL